MSADSLDTGPTPSLPAAAEPRNALEKLASLRLTLVALLLLGLGTAIAYNAQGEGEATLPLVFPLGLLAVNLMAAVATNKTFRRQSALLVFHLALIAIIVLVALGRLSYLRGSAEVVSGGEFAGLVKQEAGPWHRDHLASVRFQSQGFTIAYQPGLQRNGTRNRVRWIDDNGLPRTADIGDIDPLVIHGYRFYTTHNKGFSLVFRWHPRDGAAPLLGSVNLPAYPAHEHAQAREWQLPGADTGGPIWTQLVFDEILLDPDKDSEFRLPSRHEVVVRLGERRETLVPGGRIALEHGQLEYLELRTWMGYAVFYDWTIPWLLASCVLAVLSLGAHLWSKYFSRPWSPET
jgi:cytochrome c biogenesis protein